MANKKSHLIISQTPGDQFNLSTGGEEIVVTYRYRQGNKISLSIESNPETVKIKRIKRPDFREPLV